MQRWKRLAYYLLVNVFVSACTVWTVLSIWDRTHPGFSGELPSLALSETTPTTSTLLSTLDANNPTPLPVVTDLPAVNNPVGSVGIVTISNIFGASDLETEKVRIECTGDNGVNLTGWTLVDEDMNEFVFPQLTIYPSAQLDVFTSPGTDSPQVIYWGLLESIWAHGETASLLDADGNLQDSFQVP